MRLCAHQICAGTQVAIVVAQIKKGGAKHSESLVEMTVPSTRKETS